jgi:pimeloyl-ACP methyl ester carboxylesterase
VGGPNPAARARVRAWLAERPGPLSLRVDLIQGPMRTRPARGRLGEIAVPTLLLVGERDIPDVHAHAGAIQAGIAGAERVVIPGAGHLLPLEPAAALAQRVETFLARPPAAPPAHRRP